MALNDPQLSWAAGRGQEHEVIPDVDSTSMKAMGTAFGES